MTSPEQNLSTCGVCMGVAEFTEADPGANPVSYCARDLPAHLQARAAAGQLPLAASNTTVAQLQEQARELDVEGRSSMNKDELAAAVSEAKAADLPEQEPTDPVTMTDGGAADVLEDDVEEPEPAPKKAARKK